MAGKENATQNTGKQIANAENGYTLLVPCNNEKKIMVVCEVCGHANPQYTALCEMCSNYLTK